jgi:hypothetical protein
MNYITTIPNSDKTKYYNYRKGVDSLTVKDKYFYLRKRVNLPLMKKNAYSRVLFNKLIQKHVIFEYINQIVFGVKD